MCIYIHIYTYSCEIESLRTQGRMHLDMHFIKGPQRCQKGPQGTWYLGVSFLSVPHLCGFKGKPKGRPPLGGGGLKNKHTHPSLDMHTEVVAEFCA